MSIFDLFGYLACGLVFMTFVMTDMVPLRILALCSNVAFLVYGLGLHLKPVFILHFSLLPINAWRLWGCFMPVRLPKQSERNFTSSEYRKLEAERR